MTEYANNRLNEVFPLLEKAVTDAFDDGYRAARMQIQAERANVRGEWKHTEAIPHKVYCSACFATYLHNEKLATELPLPIHPNFCPNCGADMRGVDKDGRINL